MLSKSQLTEYCELISAMAKHNQAFSIERLAIDFKTQIEANVKKHHLEITQFLSNKIESRTFVAKSKKEAIKKAIDYYS